MEVRARFDALSDRLLCLEDMLDAIGRRLAQRESHERRSEQRLVQLVDNVTDACDRQMQAMQASEAAMVRLEQRLVRLLGDRSVESVAVREPAPAPQPMSEHSSHAVPTRTEPSSLKKPRALYSSFSELESASMLPGNYSLRGNVADMPLTTVLSMLELERRTGRLVVRGDDGTLASFELVGGAVTTSRLREATLDPLFTMREVLKWPSGRFSFQQADGDPPRPSTRSVGSLLLEATRQNDEAVRESSSGAAP